MIFGRDKSVGDWLGGLSFGGYSVSPRFGSRGSFGLGTYSLTYLGVTSIPEPGMLGILGLGLLMLWVMRRRSNLAPSVTLGVRSEPHLYLAVTRIMRELRQES